MESLVARGPEEFREKHGIEVKLFHEVKTIDLKQGKISLQAEGRSGTWEEPFDRLMLSTGCLLYTSDAADE